MKKSHYHFTGLLYLLVIILAGTSQGYIRGTLIIPDEVVNTTKQILENQFLFRMGLNFDLIAFIIDAIISVLLYHMFKSQGKLIASVMAVLRLIAHPAIGGLNLLNHHLALQFISDPSYAEVFNETQLQALSLLMLEAHQYGYLIAGAFFGVHCLFLSYLIYKSKAFPKIIGSFLLGSALGYLLETFGNFTTPTYEEYTALIVGISAAIGEVTFTLYLLIKGRKNNL